MKKSNLIKVFKVLLNKNYRFLTIALTLLFAFFILTFSYLAFYTYQRELNKVSTNNTNLSIAIEQYLEARIRLAENSINYVQFYLDHNFKEINKKNSENKYFDLSKTLYQLKSDINELEVIALIDKEGNVVANSHWNSELSFKKRKLINIADRKYFMRHKGDTNSGVVISEPQLSRTLGSQVITINKRIKTDDNHFAGIISVTINVKDITNAFYKITNDPDILIALLNEDRKLVARFPYIEKAIGITVPVIPEEEEALSVNSSNGVFIAHSVVDHVRRIFSYKAVENYPFKIYVAKNLRSVAIVWRKVFYSLSIIGIILMMIAIFLIYVYFLQLMKLEEQKIETINVARMSSLGLMAASIAHEINNPLSIVLGRASQGLKILNEDHIDLSKVKNNFNKIIESSQRMAKIINGVKVIARDGRLDNFELVPVKKIIDHVVDYVNERFKASGVELSVSDISEQIFSIKCRESQISQVLVNLVNNSFDAIESSPNDKWVKIDFQVVNETTVQFRVIDSGNGISPIIIDKIMNPLFTSKGTGKGTGLGLYISTQIIRDHHGKLFVDTKCPNTCFVVELPINQLV